jgi:hypothetical protein
VDSEYDDGGIAQFECGRTGGLQSRGRFLENEDGYRRSLRIRDHAAGQGRRWGFREWQPHATYTRFATSMVA